MSHKRTTSPWPAPPSTRKAAVPAAQLAQLAWAAPAVINHRLTRMALAGPSPDARNRREFTRMVHEKGAAFTESWQAMAQHAMGLWLPWSLSAWKAWLRPWGWGQVWTDSSRLWHEASMGTFAKGLAPVHRRAVANARRLRGQALR